MVRHMEDNSGDRDLGAYWERQFCILAGEYGRSFTPHQIGRGEAASWFGRTGRKWHQSVLPDITVWTYPGEHHEIKHKSPTRNGCFGLEVYRFNALWDFAEVTGQKVFYTIHNHELAGGRDARVNDISHWFTVEIYDLEKCLPPAVLGNSYIGGRPSSTKLYYWPASLWRPLSALWMPHGKVLAYG